MSRTAYPTKTDLGDFLYSAGLISSPKTDQQSDLLYGSAVAAAVTEWERGTGWVPFLSAGDQTRSYDPPGPEQGPVGIYIGVSNVGGDRRLFLKAGVRSVTSVTTGVTLTNPGTLLTQNRDYWLRPSNADHSDRPFTYIEFAWPQWGNPQSIVVVAPFGFGATVPDDAWSAILKMAAIELIPSLEIMLTGGQSQIRLGTDVFAFNPQVFARQTGLWQQQASAVMGRYKRKVLA